MVEKNIENNENNIHSQDKLAKLAKNIAQSYKTKLEKVEATIGARSIQQKKELLDEIQLQYLQNETEANPLSPSEKLQLNQYIKSNIAQQASENLSALKEEINKPNNKEKLVTKESKENLESSSDSNIEKLRPSEINKKNIDEQSNRENNFVKTVYTEIKGGGVGAIHTLKETTIFIKNLALGIINFPLDIYLLFTGQASYSPPRPKQK